MTTLSSYPESSGHVSHSANPTHEQIAALAYRLYCENGRQEGRELADWLRAEQLLTQRAARETTERYVEASRLQEVRPLPLREHPLARDERGSASREEIRQQTAPMRPAPRQSLRRSERSELARSH